MTKARRVTTRATGSILVVDDDRVNRTLLARTLSASGHEVGTAENGREALERLRSGSFDVVLLDIVMPELDGMSVLEEMKADPVLRDVPVIMISALDDFDSVVRCIELGAEDYLPKPFDPVLLRARINAGLGRRMLYELERARVHDVFARFLPESIVTEVLARADGGARLGGVRLIGTVLFTDLRGFTTFAEHTAPDRVIDVLNRFLSEMSDAVLDNGGTLVSYLGDGLLAVFGAPIECDDHADRRSPLRGRCSTAAAALQRLARREEHAAGFAMGVGVSSGPLMSGNVGSERRLEYTAIGDTVNTASRIEAHTKEVPHHALFSDSTRALLTRPDELVLVGDITLRGRTSPTRLWGLASPDQLSEKAEATT